MKARHHLLFFIILMVATSMLFFSTALLLPTELKNAVFRSPQIDTTGHFIGFFVFAWLMHYLLKTTLISTFFTLAFYGALSELGQYYLGFRNGEFSDFFADIAGIVFFISLKIFYSFYKKTLLHKLILKQKVES
ncbi:MAG: VanZ family protein [Colwellia sp.]|nr:VanZ family protein [Colwellia sp.]